MPIIKRLNAVRKVAILPAFNVQDTIVKTIIKCEQYVDEVVVVDDGSSDLTAVIAKRLGATVISHGRNMGKGSALASGFRYAKEVGACVVVTLDTDGQHDPDDIPSLIAPILNGECDISNGSRFLSKHEMPYSRRFGNWLISIVSPKPEGVKDTQSGFRAYSRHAIQKIAVREKGMSVDSEILKCASEEGLRIKEVPISVRYKGVRKPSTRNPLMHGVEVLSYLIKVIVEANPLLYLGSFGLTLMVFGVLAGVRVVDIFVRNRLIAVGTALISICLLMIGFMSIMAALILYSMSTADRRRHNYDEGK